jgi:heme oxygenase (mycobilin-producing)
LDGFIEMQVLQPEKSGEPYLVISQWKSEAGFNEWLESPEFKEGHKRAFEDLRQAKVRGENPPMHSKFLTYSVLSR